jgi:hypothetical protein
MKNIGYVTALKRFNIKNFNKTYSYFPATFLQSSTSFITCSNSSDFLEKASDAVFSSWSFAKIDVLFERAPKMHSYEIRNDYTTENRDHIVSFNREA